MGTDSSQELPKIDFHTKIWPRDHRLLKLLALKYGNIQNVIEEAIQLLRVRESLRDPDIMKEISKREIDLYETQHLMLGDLRMVAVGRRTFLSFIQSIPEAPIKDNNALELIEWFYDDEIRLGELFLLQILQAIQSLWVSGNYFLRINIQSLSDSDLDSPGHQPHAYKMIFYHNCDDQAYGNYWTAYFEYFLTHTPLDFEIKQKTIRPQSFYMEIHEKPRETAPNTKGDH